VLVVLREMGGVAWRDGRGFGWNHVRVDHEEHVWEGWEEEGTGRKRRRSGSSATSERTKDGGKLNALVPK